MRRERLYQEETTGMASSMEENDIAKLIYLNQENVFSEWWHRKFEKERKMIWWFESDNLFYIDKKTWNEIQKAKIVLRRNGEVINQESYRDVNMEIRKGIQIDYHDILKIRRFIRCSIIGTINEGRANYEYIKLMKEMKIANRISKIEDWLLNNNWNSEIMKDIINIHIMGCPKLIKFEKIAKFENCSVIIPSNPEFEMVKDINLNKVNKAVNFLKWKRCKYRPNKIIMDNEEAARILKI
jgi:hypothetical protein